MNFSLFRHELKLMIQSRKNLLFILFFLIGIFVYIFIVLEKEVKIESLDVEKTSSEVMELESLQKARESRRHTGGGYSPWSFYSNNNHKYLLNRGILQAYEDQNFERMLYLRTYYLYSLYNNSIVEEEFFQDSDFPWKDRAHYIDKKVRENEALLQSGIEITYEMIEEKTALQALKNIFLTFGPYILLFSAIYFSNDVLVRDRNQTSSVQGLPISWYQYIHTKSLVAITYTLFILIGLLIVTVIALTLSKGFGSFKMEVPILTVHEEGNMWFTNEYSTISMLKYFAMIFSFVPVFMYIFIRLNMIISLFLRNEWIVLLVSSLLLFSERFYYARDKQKLFNIGIENFPQTFFDFGKIITGEKNFLLYMNKLTYEKGLIMMVMTLILVELFLFLSTKIVTKDRFFN